MTLENHSAVGHMELDGIGIQNRDGTVHIGGNVNISAYAQAGYSDTNCTNLDDLPDAAFNAANKQDLPLCLENTRRDVLAEIEQWADGDSDKYIFWLKGMAGTGKSTIARTIARKYYDVRRLGGSFFFSRGGGDLASAAKFPSTIAAQLADVSETLNKAIKTARYSNSISKLGLFDQWKKLVLEPLAVSAKKAHSSPLVLVIDALDECDDEDEIRLLIHCLATTFTGSFKLRIFITSRPDQPVNVGFSSVSPDTYSGFILHDIEQSIVDQDLELYYKSELNKTRLRFGLSEKFLSDDTIRLLVARSTGLFIHAATVCRFVHAGQRSCDERLSHIIDAQDSPINPEKALDQMYLNVLEYSTRNPPKLEGGLEFELKPEELESRKALFQQIVGSIVLLSDPMTCSDLAILLGQSVNDITKTLHSLHSVLDVPKDSTKAIRLLHPSLRDFLLDPQRCRDEVFFINAQDSHGRLYRRCLSLICDEERLPQDPLQVKQPGIRARMIAKADVKKSISQPVQYTCRWWIHHLLNSKVDLAKDQLIIDFFQTHFLFWLESLAWSSQLSDGIILLKRLEADFAFKNGSNAPNRPAHKRSLAHSLKIKLKSLRRSTNNLDQIIYDAMRFALAHSSIIEEAPLQVYSSALLFSPEQSLIRRQYWNRIPNWVQKKPMFSGTWSLHLQTLTHEYPVNAVAFSPDGRSIASGSDEIVRLWNATTGAEYSRLEGHRERVLAIVFSQDGRLIVSSSNKDIVLWNATTGAEYSRLVAVEEAGHGAEVWAIALSPGGPDGQLIAWSLGLRDGTVRIWNPMTGDKYSQQPREGEAELCLSAISFSPDGRLIASGWSDGMVRIRDVTTGAECSRIDCNRRIDQVAFSPDGRLIASGSVDGIVRLWNARTGHLNWKLKSSPNYGRWGGPLAFSPDGQLIAARSISDGQTVQLWNTTTGAKHSKLKGHQGRVRAVAFSPDGQLIASGSKDGTVRLWETAAVNKHSGFKQSAARARAVTLSDQLIATSSRNTILLWDATTGAKSSEINVGSVIYALVFSPDGQLIASLSSDRLLRVWDARKGNECLRYAIHSHLPAIAFSNNRCIGLASDDGLKLLDISKKIQVGPTMILPTHGISVIAFPPDETDLASLAFGSKGTVQLCRVIEGANKYTEYSRTQHGSHFVTAIAYSPDSKRVALSWSDSTVQLWDITEGGKVHTLRIDVSLYYLRFSPCGTILITDRGSFEICSVPRPSGSIFASNSWIQIDGRDIIFIHPDNRRHIMCIFRNLILFDSGQVLQIQLPV